MCGTGEVGEVNELRSEQDLLEIYSNVTASAQWSSDLIGPRTHQTG